MEIGQDEESDSDEEAEEGRRRNPYTEFLQNIEDEGSEEEVNFDFMFSTLSAVKFNGFF